MRGKWKNQEKMKLCLNGRLKEKHKGNIEEFLKFSLIHISKYWSLEDMVNYTACQNSLPDQPLLQGRVNIC